LDKGGREEGRKAGRGRGEGGKGKGVRGRGKGVRGEGERINREGEGGKGEGQGKSSENDVQIILSWLQLDQKPRQASKLLSFTSCCGILYNEYYTHNLIF